MSLAVLFDLSDAKQLTALPALAIWNSPSRHCLIPSLHMETWKRAGFMGVSEREQKGQMWKARYCDEVEKEYRTTMQRGQASLVPLLTKDLGKSKKSKTSSAQPLGTLQNAHIMFLKKVTLFSWNFCRICTHLYNISQVDFLIRKEV